MSDETPEVPAAEPVVETPGAPTAQETANERMNFFIKEYGELVAKHQMDFATYPMWQPDQNGGFRTVIQSTPVDVSGQQMKSPFIPDSTN